MRPSTVPARIITAVFSVIVAPVGVGVLNAGGRTWQYAFGAYGGVDAAEFAGPVLLQALGILLLLAVVATGFWSSAGLLSVGVLSVVPIVLALFPVLLLDMYQSPLPMEWVDGIMYGIPLALFPAFGAMGLALLLSKRYPARPNTALSVVGLFVAPVLLIAGAWLLTLGLARGTLVALQQFRFDFAIDAAASVLVGVILIVAGIMTTRWSPFALLLPALVLLIITPMSLTPVSGFYDLIFRASMDLSRALLPLLLTGAGVAAALSYVLFTVVLLRARRRARVGGAPIGPYAQTYPYPPAQPYPAPQPAQTYPPAQPPAYPGQPHAQP